VQATPQLGLHLAQLGLPSLAHRLAQHREPSLPRLAARVREAEEVEGLWFPVAPVSPIPGRIAAEVDKTRLVGMQRQPELRETLPKLGEEACGLLPVLESHDEIIGEAHHGR